jgi:hypothetical protein
MSGLVVPPPPVGLPPSLVPLYEEARTVADPSPASACAILRLLVRAVLQDRGRTGRNLVRDVGVLVEEGAPVSLLRALDVIGLSDEQSKRPGELVLSDGHAEAQNLFMFVNLLVDQTGPARGPGDR